MSKVKWLEPDEVADSVRPYVDFDSQGQQREAHGKCPLFVSVQCPDCGEWRSVRASRLRYGNKVRHMSARCASCAVAAGIAAGGHDDWYTNTDGYMCIAISQLEGQ
ncbi:MAG: hypothetical protein H8D74_02600, partial [Chloroflexi bacterium]|nr:hypothetical protein [Chloroflexota bacterium]